MTDLRESTSLVDAKRYQQLQEGQEKQWEAYCRNCGACCGTADEDPCEHLIKLDNSQYSCTIYSNRFGLHKTVGGRPFQCVPIRSILDKSWPGDQGCAYKKNM